MNKYLYFVSVFLKAVIQYLIIYLVSWSFGSTGLSDYYFIVACYSILSILLTFGVNNSFIRFSKLIRINKVIYGKFLILFSTLITFTVFLFLAIENLSYLIIALSFTKCLYLLFESVNVSVGNYLRIIRTNGSYLIIVLISFWLVNTFSFRLETFLLFLCVTESLFIFSNSIKYISSAYRKSINIFLRQVKSLVGYSVFIWGIGLLNTLLFTVDRFIIEHYLEPESLAIYGTLAVTFFSLHRFFSTPYLTILARNYYIVKNGMYLFRYVMLGVLPLSFSLLLLIYLSPWIFHILSLNSPDFGLQIFTAVNVIILYFYTAVIIEFKRKAKMFILLRVTFVMACISILFNYFSIVTLQLHAPIISFTLAYMTALFVLLFILGLKKYGFRNTG